MTHFVVVALLPPRITNPRDKTAIDDALNALLAPYSEHIDVEPYREYVQGERLQWYRDWLVEHGYSTDPASMVTHGQEWLGYPAGYDDERGELYYLNTYNTKSRWDWWEIGGRYDQYFTWKDTRFRNIGPVEQIDIPEPPSHIISADGEWHARGRNGWFGTFTEDKEMTEEKWRAKFYEILSGHRTSMAVIIDCHI